MPRVRRFFKSCRAELLGLGALGVLFTLATMSSRADYQITNSYCYAGYQCSASVGCPGNSSCTVQGVSCGNYLSGTNLNTCYSYSYYNCTVNQGSFTCTNLCTCTCQQGWGGSWSCGSTTACSASGTTPTTCN